MIRAILLDIEGTTTPIDFVHKVLFPFAKRRIAEFVRENWSSIAPELSSLVDERSGDSAYRMPLDISSPTSVADYLEFLIDEDRKSTPLKSLQGRLWQTGYESGELRSVLYDDVSPALSDWHARGLRIAIYSSGSVLAQKLIFRYSDHGDLSGLISSYFDTSIGSKRESRSYSRIAEELEMPPNSILFVSDVVPELNAAASVGMRTVLSIRPGNSDSATLHSHGSISLFDQIVV